MIRRIGITGATGYIGRHLERRAEDEGFEIIRLVRKPTKPSDRHCDINSDFVPGITRGIDAIVHLALNIDEALVGNPHEMAFANGLVEECAEAGIPLIFVSSQAACEPVSRYGFTKRALETVFLTRGADVVRPGLVYGGLELGLWGTLARVVERAPLIPDLGSGAKVQPIHVDDLAEGLIRVLRKRQPGSSGNVWMLSGPTIFFSRFLRVMGEHRFGKRVNMLPIPISIAYLVLAITGKVFGPRLAPARLHSLVNLQEMPGPEHARALGVTLRSLENGMSRSGATTRAELLHATREIRAIMGNHQFPWVARRIVRARRHIHDAGLEAITSALLPIRTLEASRIALVDMQPISGRLRSLTALASALFQSIPHVPRLLRRVLE